MKQKKTAKKSSPKPLKGTPKTPPRIKMGGSSRSRPKGRIIINENLDGIPHTIIETDQMTKEQIEAHSKNPLNKKNSDYEEQIEVWRERALVAEKSLVIRLNEIETLKNGQLLPADKAAPMNVQKMKEQIIQLQEKLAPFKYEFTVGGSLVSVMVRPRAREVIPLTQ